MGHDHEKWRQHTNGVFVRLLKTNEYVEHFNLAGSRMYQSAFLPLASPEEANRVTTSDSWVMRRRLKPSAGSPLVDRALSCHSGDVSDEGWSSWGTSS